MMPSTTSGYRRGALLLALFAVVCVLVAIQPGVRSLLVSSMGGPVVLSVAVGLLVLVAGLFSLRASGGSVSPSEADSVSLLRESMPSEEDQEPDTPATPAVETPHAPVKPRPGLRDERPVLKQLPLQWTDESGGNQTKLVDVLSYSENEFSLAVDGEFRKGQPVWIADDDVLRRGVI